MGLSGGFLGTLMSALAGAQQPSSASPNPAQPSPQAPQNNSVQNLGYASPKLEDFLMQQQQSAQPGAQPQGAGQQAQPRTTGMKGYLSDILYNMGEAAKVHLGMPTDAQKQAMAMKSQTERMQAEADSMYKRAAASQFQLVPVQMPDGTVAHVQQKDAEKFQQQYVTNYGKQNVANTYANEKLTVAQLKSKIESGVVARVEDTKLPDGTLGKLAYDKYNHVIGVVPGALAKESYYPQQGSGIQIIEGADGVEHIVAKPTFHAPVIPASPTPTIGAPQQQTVTPNLPQPVTNAASAQPTISASAPAPVPQQSQARSRPTIAAPQAATAPAPNVPTAPPQQKGVLPFMGPRGAELVEAFDPKTQQYSYVNRSDAGPSSGLQVMGKVTDVQFDNAKNDNRRLVDITKKIGQYASNFDESQPLGAADKYLIGAMLQDNHLNESVVGAGIDGAMGQVQKWFNAAPEQTRARVQGVLSTQAAQRYIDYINAREALTGYQKLLTGQGRSSDKVLELQLQSIPAPNTDEQYANMASKAFMGQLRTVSQGRPTIRGMDNPNQILDQQDALFKQREYAAVQNNRGKQQEAVRQSQLPQITDDSSFRALAKTGQIASVTRVDSGSVRLLDKSGKVIGIYSTDRDPASIKGLADTVAQTGDLGQQQQSENDQFPQIKDDLALRELAKTGKIRYVNPNNDGTVKLLDKSKNVIGVYRTNQTAEAVVSTINANLP